MKRASFLQSIGFISISPFLTHFEEPSKKTLILFIGINDLGLIDYLPQSPEKVVLTPRIINDLNYKQLVLEP